MKETRPRETRTYRGGSLEELLPQILAELGPEALITKQREGVVGGVNGFFGKRCVEVDVEIEAAAPAAPAPVAAPAVLTPAVPHRAVVDAYDTGSPIIDAVFAQALPFADHLTAATATVDPSATDTATATLRVPEPWDDVDLSDLDLDVDLDLDLMLDPFATPERKQAKEWARQEISAMKADIAEREGGAISVAPAPAPVVVVAPAQAQAPAPAQVPVAVVVAPAPTQAQARAQAPPPATASTSVAVRSSFSPSRPAAALAASAAAEPGTLPVRRGATGMVAVTEALMEAGLPEGLAMAIHKDVAREVRPFVTDEPARDQARAALARRIKTKSGWRGKRRTIALVGVPGAGKTLTAAKLCHAFAIGGGLSVGLLSLESPRTALRLGLLTDGIGVDFQIADQPSQVALAAGRVDARDLIVVDTPGAEADDDVSMDRLERLLVALRPDETHFLVPASADITPSQKLLDALAGRIGVDRILITRLDEAPTLGLQVALSISSRLPISYLASGATAELGLAPADPFALASLVLP